MTSRSFLGVGQVDAHLFHVACQTLIQSEIDTDNAWTEADVWAADLTLFFFFNKFLKTKNTKIFFLLTSYYFILDIYQIMQRIQLKVMNGDKLIV